MSRKGTNRNTMTTTQIHAQQPLHKSVCRFHWANTGTHHMSPFHFTGIYSASALTISFITYHSVRSRCSLLFSLIAHRTEFTLSVGEKSHFHSQHMVFGETLFNALARIPKWYIFISQQTQHAQRGKIFVVDIERVSFAELFNTYGAFYRFGSRD